MTMARVLTNRRNDMDDAVEDLDQFDSTLDGLKESKYSCSSRIHAIDTF